MPTSPPRRAPAAGPVPGLDAGPTVAVIGGGPAGLSAALYLARYLRPVLLHDSGHGRWTGGQINHNLLGFPGGVAATRLHDLGLEQLAEYRHVQVLGTAVEALRRVEGGFQLAGQGWVSEAAAVILATGVRDDFLHFPGWEAFVGRGLVWCLTCDAWESRGGRLVVVGAGRAAAGEALQLRRYTEQVTLVSNREEPLPPDLRGGLARGGVRLCEAVVRGGEGDLATGRLSALRLVGGDRLPCDRVFSVQGAEPSAGLAAELGARRGPHGYLEVDVEQRTSIPRLYAAGDLTRPHSHQVATALHEGAQAASACNHDLYPAALRL